MSELRAINYEYLPDVVTFLRRHFGLRCWFEDPEQEDLKLQMRKLTGEQILEVLGLYGVAVKASMARDHEASLTVFVGGPCNGKRHCRFGMGTTIVVHVGFAKWASYRIGDDHHRAWFVGTETSKKKAQKLAYFGAK